MESTCTFTGARADQLSARLERPDGPIRGSALFGHCFTCSTDLRMERQLTQALSAQGYEVLSFDFAGLGRSGGDFASSSYSADVADLLAAASYLGETVEAPSLLLEHSLGGAAVLSAAPSLPSVRAVATIGKSFLDELERGNPCDRIADFTGATMILHAPRDAFVSITNAELLYRAAHHPKSFVSLDDADHLLAKETDAHYVATVIAAWAQHYLPEDAASPGTEHAGYDSAGATDSNNGGFVTRLESRGFVLAADEPTVAGGTQTGPTPYDYLTMALASCTAMTMRVYADRKGWEIGGLIAHVEHDRVHATDCQECEHTSGRIDRLNRTLEFPEDFTEEQRQAMLRIADRCPVHLTVEGQIEVHTTLHPPRST